MGFHDMAVECARDASGLIGKMFTIAVARHGISNDCVMAWSGSLPSDQLALFDDHLVTSRPSE